MTTTRQLSRNYDALTASERAALCIRALARQDDAEFQRLCDTAQREYWSAPDHSSIVKAISVMSCLYHIEQLGLALGYWFAVGESALDIIDEKNDGSSGGVGHDLMGNVSAYLYVVNREAWTRFCEDIGIDATDLPADGLFQLLLNLCDENMPRMAPSRAELAAALKNYGNAEASPVTVDDVLAGWRDIFADLTGDTCPNQA